MIGFVEAILERQDRKDLDKKLESFQIETAVRNSVREVVASFSEKLHKN